MYVFLEFLQVEIVLLCEKYRVNGEHTAQVHIPTTSQVQKETHTCTCTHKHRHRCVLCPLSLGGKVWGGKEIDRVVMAGRLVDEEQTGFRRGRGCEDQTFSQMHSW